MADACDIMERTSDPDVNLTDLEAQCRIKRSRQILRRHGPRNARFLMSSNYECSESEISESESSESDNCLELPDPFEQPRFTFTPEILYVRTEEEESSDSGSCSSLKAESSDQSRDGDKYKKAYRFVFRRAGWFRCSLTNLVFVMEGEGEVLYKVVSWDPRLLDGLGQMQPAGPLYSIDCSAGSISQLHFPHCEIFEENKECLAVAHFTGGNIEVIQPVDVTDTHVITDIRGLSLFGLIKKIFSGSPIGGQVLLFLRSAIVEQKQKVLHVHLLPGNVPVSEVQYWHKDKKYIETSSKCQLFPGRKYSVCCQPEECEVQPETETFELGHFGPNYHPTFEVFLDVNIEEVRLGILDEMEDEKEVWNRRRILISAPSQGEEPSTLRMTESKFVNKHRDKLIQRVSSVMAIADGLRSKNMISDEMYSNIRAAKPRQEKMRLLLDVLDSGGASVKAEFYRLLKEKEPLLVDDLESGHSGLQ